jgi:hypothetical protein
MERAEDPAAAARQRRERIISYAMIAYVSLCALFTLALMLRVSLLH